MKLKRLVCLVCAILMLASTCITSCNLNDPGDIKDAIEDITNSEHEHSWDNWTFDYTKTDVRVVCTVCGDIIKSHPVSNGLEIEDGVLLGIGACTDSVIVVPNEVTIIGDSAFKNNDDLTGILLPNTLTVIGSSAFENCTSLTVVNIPEGVQLIDRTAFKNCKGLYGILLPESLAYMGKECFADCPLLITLHYKGNSDGWNNIGKHEEWVDNTEHKDLNYKDWGNDCNHQWSAWEIIKSYFCYTEGEVQRVCSKCDKVEREKREPTHECSEQIQEQIILKITDPTCFSYGREAILCLCGETVAAWNFNSKLLWISF